MLLSEEAPAEKLSTGGCEVSAAVDSCRSTGANTHFLPFCYALFTISGIPALLYQIVWQRALFTIYGVNIESVTVIVTVFMLGLGLGSLAGGRISLLRINTLRAFGLIELGIGLFGVASLSIFHSLGVATARYSILGAGAVAFALLLIPTVLMGSTLPLLVAHLVRVKENVGASVGSLYCVNTLGSGIACLAAALCLMRLFGESGTVHLAAAMNATVGLTVVLLSFRSAAAKIDRRPSETHTVAHAPELGFPIALLLSALVGFISLAYEILWYRIYSFATGTSAPCFAKLLGFYLLGIGYGSLVVRDVCSKRPPSGHMRRRLAAVLVCGTLLGFSIGPLLGVFIQRVPYDFTFPFVFVSAALLGSAFPLLSHAAIRPDSHSGKRLSILYLANIIGSTLGTFLVGFVILDRWSTQQTALFLLLLGTVSALVLCICQRPVRVRMPIAFAGLTAALLVIGSGRMYGRLYEKLLFKANYTDATHFTNLIENRSGVVAVDKQEYVWGGGVYDGQFNTDLLHDSNGLFRLYAVLALHPHPRHVLMIGLASGSWAQVIANDSEVETLTIVEINPGYLPLIAERPAVRTLLQNPKVVIVIDDGRRWLLHHPERKFDLVVSNTTWNWRANVSNLLSIEFLELMRAHLNAGAIHYYNTTWSPEVLITGARVFPYALRISNFLAVSDSPMRLDKERYRTLLERYVVEGKQVFNLSQTFDRSRLEEVLDFRERVRGEQGSTDGNPLETGDSILSRLKSARSITDDNMGTEWE